MRARSRHPLLGREKSKPKAWYERSEGVARLAHDKELVAAHYPTLSYRIDSEAGQAHLEGTLVYRAACGIPTEVEVRIDFPSDYPKSEPRAFDAAGRFEHTLDRHFASKEGKCCLWLPPKSRWDPRNPDALIPFLDEVVVFFDRQLVYDAGGQVSWPGGQYGHRADGYMQWITEEFGGSAEIVTALAPVLAGARRVGRNDRCPCPEGLKFKRCHGEVVDRIRRSISPALLRSLFQL